MSSFLFSLRPRIILCLFRNRYLSLVFLSLEMPSQSTNPSILPFILGGRVPRNIFSLTLNSLIPGVLVFYGCCDRILQVPGL